MFYCLEFWQMTQEIWFNSQLSQQTNWLALVKLPSGSISAVHMGIIQTTLRNNESPSALDNALECIMHIKELQSNIMLQHACLTQAIVHTCDPLYRMEKVNTTNANEGGSTERKQEHRPSDTCSYSPSQYLEKENVLRSSVSIASIQQTNYSN